MLKAVETVGYISIICGRGNSVLFVMKYANNGNGAHIIFERFS